MSSRLEHALRYAKARTLEPKPKPAMFVYLLRCGEFYKIGIANNIKARVSNIQCSSPYQIEHVKSWRDDNAKVTERRLHRLLNGYLERGEWFRLPIELVVSLGTCGQSPVETVIKFLRG